MSLFAGFMHTSLSLAQMGGGLDPFVDPSFNPAKAHSVWSLGSFE